MFRCDNSVDGAIDSWAEVGVVGVDEKNAERKQTCGSIVGVAMKKRECDGVIVAREKEQSGDGDECVVVDDNAADNAAEHNVDDELTDGIVEEEFDNRIPRRVERGFSVVIIVDVEEFASVDVVIHGIVEE